MTDLLPQMMSSSDIISVILDVSIHYALFEDEEDLSLQMKAVRTTLCALQGTKEKEETK